MPARSWAVVGTVAGQRQKHETNQTLRSSGHLTSGTTSLYHGSGLSSSENHCPVVDSLSLIRLYTTVAVVDQFALDDIEGASAYVGNESPLLDSSPLDLGATAMLPFQTCRPCCSPRPPCVAESHWYTHHALIIAHTPLKYIREIIGTCPRRSIFDVIVSWHVLCYNRNLFLWVSREEQGRCQADHARSRHCLSAICSHCCFGAMIVDTPKRQCLCSPWEKTAATVISFL